MKKSNSTKKALGAFRKLGVVALMVATTLTLAMCFTACNQTGNTGGGGGKPTPTPKPKHAITFSVDSTTPNGTLKAKADGVPETATSPITVEEGKTLTFTATANAGYRVKGWTLDGNAVNGTNNSYSFTVSKAVSVKVSFEDASTPLPKHKITFSVDGANGTLKAKADGVPETATSPINVEEGKTVTFTAEPSTNYKVKEWKVGDTVVTGNKTNTYAHTVTKAVTVKVSFEANSNPPNPPTPQTKYTVTLNQTANGKVTASPEIPEDKKVDKDTEITFTAKADSGYRVNTWSVSPSSAIQSGGGKGETTATLKITANTTVSVSFEAVPKHAITFSVEGANGTLKAKVDEKEITSGDEVEQGKTVTFTAEADIGYVVKKWTLDGNTVNGTEKTYTLTVTQACKVTVSFELVPIGTAILTLNDHTIDVSAKTADGSAIQVEGCTKTTLKSDMRTELHATGETVTLKGKIIELECRNNQLIALNVQGLTYLQKLDCNHNQLTALDVQGLTSLQKLDCNRNQLTALDVQGLTSLQELECRNNQLTSLNVQGLTELQLLNCYENQLTTLDVQGLTSLQKFYCYDNKLTELNMQGLTALEELACNNNQLTALDLQGLTSLQRLFCNGNQLTSLNVQGLNALQLLHCYNNQLNAQVMTKLLNALPARGASDNAWAVLYTKKTGVTEGNCKDFTQSEDLKTAFDAAKKRNWKLQREVSFKQYEDI